MHLRKSWFGYLWFAVGTLLIGSYLYTQFFSLFGELINNNWGHVHFAGIDLSCVLAACLLIVCIGLFFLVSFIKKAVCPFNERVSLLLKKIFFAVLFAAFLFYGCYSRYLMISSILESGERLGFASSFAVSVLNSVNYEKTGAIGLLFDKILYIFLGIFGEKEIVIGYLNGIMFIVASVLVCFAVLYCFNGFCGLAVFGYLMFMPASPLLLFNPSGKNLWFLLVSLFVFIVSYFLDAIKDKYEELSYFLFLILNLSLLVINHFLYIPFLFRSGINSLFFDFSFSNNHIIAGVVTIFALYGCLSFLNHNDDRTSLVNIFLITLSVLLLTDFSTNQLQYPLAVCIFIIAGFGVKNFFFEGYNDQFIISEPEVIYENHENSDEMKSDDKVEEESAEKEQVINEKSVGKKEVADGLEQIEIPKPVKPRFIENPLPVPKKHVKKTIDYAFEPSSDKMEYDIAIDDKDDFDIK